jgi:hypothetical protein
MLKKIQGIAVFFIVLAGPALMAQTEIRVVTVPMVRVYLGPVENGTTEEREYFTNSMTMEFTAAGYQLVDSKEGSDYNLTEEISRDENEEPPNGIRLVLFETKSGREVITQTYGYRDLTDMDTWNLYAITQMMSNTPIIKISPDAEMLGVLPENRAPDNEKPRHRMAFYLGLQAGGILDFSYIQNSGGYEGGVSRSFSGEGALAAEFQPLRFLSLQTEAVVIYDTFQASRVTQSGGVETRTTGTFRSLSLMIPLWIKMPVTMDGFVLSPFVGAYYLLPLDVMKNGSYKTEPPFGISLGFEWGIPLNSQLLCFGLRVDYDIGLSSTGEGGALQYSRTRTGLFAGYKFRLWRAKEQGASNK